MQSSSHVFTASWCGSKLPSDSAWLHSIAAILIVPFELNVARSVMKEGEGFSFGRATLGGFGILNAGVTGLDDFGGDAAGTIGASTVCSWR